MNKYVHGDTCRHLPMWLYSLLLQHAMPCSAVLAIVLIPVLTCRLQYWRPPEALSGCQPGMESNVYAFGMLVYEVLLRREPYQDEDQEVNSKLRSSTTHAPDPHLH